jgi:hypothetical protein
MALLMFFYVVYSAAGRQIILIYQRLQPQLLFMKCTRHFSRTQGFSVKSPFSTKGIFSIAGDFSFVKPVAGQIDKGGISCSHHPFYKIGGPENLYQNT